MYDGKRPHGNLNFRFQTVCTQTCNGQSAKENFRKHYVCHISKNVACISLYIYIFFACSSKCGGKLCYGTSYCLAGTLFLNYCEFDENPSTISSYFSVCVCEIVSLLIFFVQKKWKGAGVNFSTLLKTNHVFEKGCLSHLPKLVSTSKSYFLHQSLRTLTLPGVPS